MSHYPCLRRTPLAITLLVSFLGASAQPSPEVDPTAPLGLGIAVVRVTGAPPPLRFYSHPALREVPDSVPLSAATVTDSVTFRPGRPRASVGTAPPWFLPEWLDIARGHVGLRVETLSRDWAEVVTNRTDGRTAWIRRDRVELVSWPEVILSSLLVARAPDGNPIRERPHAESSILATTPDGWPLGVFAVRGDWALVTTLGLADRIPPSGWIRWREDDRLAVALTTDD